LLAGIESKGLFVKWGGIKLMLRLDTCGEAPMPRLVELLKVVMLKQFLVELGWVIEV
jgi:hypothetical protein